MIFISFLKDIPTVRLDYFDLKKLLKYHFTQKNPQRGILCGVVQESDLSRAVGYFAACFSAARAADRRATGTRNGEQLT